VSLWPFTVISALNINGQIYLLINNHNNWANAVDHTYLSTLRATCLKFVKFSYMLSVWLEEQTGK